jgi:cytochrome c oxidase cbb3-type subunit 3
MEPREIAEYPSEDLPPKDGIGEDDNKIPTWFTVSFLATIAWAAVYLPFYLFSGWSAESQWAAEVERGNALAAQVKQALPTANPYRGDAEAIAVGQDVFTTTCAVCHKPDGSGLVGPSLVDPYWKYGRTDVALYETVDKGRPLGMPPWGQQLGGEKIWKVLAYMETLPTTDEPGVGAPEGWTPEG